MNRVGWTLVAVLALSCAWDVRQLLSGGTGFATLPVFVPVSLEYERQMREERGQPAGRGGEEAVETARRLLEAPVDPSKREAIERLRDTRAKLLDARGRRHALNIRLMDVGIAVTRELTPAQWDAIHMQRDQLRGKADAELFERVLSRMR